ncbi:multidrug resistance protein MdtN [Burkholderia territorii]|uniref:Multidrug resistance protein MdtN n=1 Tax=Burkholderia territorii TaxID=1503055 RepID=A0A119AP23_9BURK|nr:multidrug transporter subunit MdtN [Burkholderia territorii]KVV40028.1 multidrug resistance protein MdtN [Burkholderia territorii]KVX49083.1 multidrug resistance protein MdtN [Burkholderia territorii]
MSARAISEKKGKFVVLIIVAAALALLALALWLADGSPKTDDAYVYADKVDVTSEVAGRIVEMPVHDNQRVKKGDLLFRLDPRPFEASLAQAKAQLDVLDKQIELTQRTVDSQRFNARAAEAAVAGARANAKQADDTLRRLEPLLEKGYAAPEDVDKARTAQRTSQAQLDSAQLQARQAQAAVSSVAALIAQKAAVQAQIAEAALRLEYATVRAPFDGRIVALDTRVGQYASPSKPIFTLIATDRWFVVANFRETDLKDIKSGTRATVYVMSDTSQQFDGVVDSVGYGVTPTDGGTLLDGLPRVARTINWVHVSQRFPVKIKVESPDESLFRVGASAIAILHRDECVAQASIRP